MSVTLPAIEQHARQRLWLACIWAWPLCIVAFGLSFVVIAGFLRKEALVSGQILHADIGQYYGDQGGRDIRS